MQKFKEKEHSIAMLLSKKEKYESRKNYDYAFIFYFTKKNELWSGSEQEVLVLFIAFQKKNGYFLVNIKPKIRVYRWLNNFDSDLFKDKTIAM